MSGLMLGMSSFSMFGGAGVCNTVPVLEKAPDLRMNSARAAMPLLVRPTELIKRKRNCLIKVLVTYIAKNSI